MTTACIEKYELKDRPSVDRLPQQQQQRIESVRVLSKRYLKFWGCGNMLYLNITPNPDYTTQYQPYRDYALIEQTPDRWYYVVRRQAVQSLARLRIEQDIRSKGYTPIRWSTGRDDDKNYHHYYVYVQPIRVKKQSISTTITSTIRWISVGLFAIAGIAIILLLKR